MKNKTPFHEFKRRIFSFPFEEIGCTSPPREFAQELEPLFTRVYPGEPTQQTQGKPYNPVIFGYSHENGQIEAAPIAKKIEELKSAQHNIQVALEILRPKSPQWIKDFLRDEKEFNGRGTICGNIPTEGRVAKLRSYRTELKKSTSTALLLWFLETKTPFLTVEHEETMEWIDEDENDPRFVGKQFSGIPWSNLRPFYTAISRDIHALRVIAEARPTVICVGVYHALKYDFLLERNGENSFYFCSKRFLRDYLGWNVIQKMWKKSHELYLTSPPQR